MSLSLPNQVDDIFAWRCVKFKIKLVHLSLLLEVMHEQGGLHEQTSMRIQVISGRFTFVTSNYFSLRMILTNCWKLFHE